MLMDTIVISIMEFTTTQTQLLRIDLKSLMFHHATLESITNSYSVRTHSLTIHKENLIQLIIVNVTDLDGQGDTIRSRFYEEFKLLLADEVASAADVTFMRITRLYSIGLGKRL